MLDRRVESLARPLRSKRRFMPHFLEAIRIQGLRGIEDLRVDFQYPVTVIAGENASGKSTVLQAAACAYEVPGPSRDDFAPMVQFPQLPRQRERGGEIGRAALSFEYKTPEGRTAMQWLHDRAWERRLNGNGGAQPSRPVNFRAAGSPHALPDPRRLRRLLGGSGEVNADPFSPYQIDLAEQLLPFRYAQVVELSDGYSRVLHAERADGPSYSELQMAAGERAILRLARDLAELRNALILIDEVETSLHPWLQQLLMIQLQQLAVQHDLQVIASTHSPVVLDSVPEDGRIFLQREPGGGVAARDAYRDVVQDALYGRSIESLNVLCEDQAAEGILNGVLDVLRPKHLLGHDSIRIGRDTGADEFPSHARAFKKFAQLFNFVFVLDGDQRTRGIDVRIQEASTRELHILFLPGNGAPEEWVWDVLARDAAEIAAELGTDGAALAIRVQRLDSVYNASSDTAAAIAKSKLFDLADGLDRTTAELCRLVGRREATVPGSPLRTVVAGIEDALAQWRSSG